MIIVDNALAKREQDGHPVRVALVGAGYMGRAISARIAETRGMRLVAIANRTLPRAAHAYSEAGIRSARRVETVGEMESAIAQRESAITDDARLACRADGIDAVIEATGDVEFGAQVALEAIGHRKHVVLVNAELDATLGPLLKLYADRSGVIMTNADGDEPAVAMNLFRFVKAIGCDPVLAGNLKGFIDPYRTPDTQRAFAEKVQQKPRKITSFADGTKLAMEATVLANATGFRVGIRGMYGPRCPHVKDLMDYFPTARLLEPGMVDYILGAEPGSGVFVVGRCVNPIKRQYMSYFKMGSGPYYVFYTPYHMPPFEIPITVARAVLFHDAAVTPKGGPVCEVIAVAKRNLKIGEELDGIGGYMSYGVIENVEVSVRENLLPMGVSQGCILRRDVQVAEAITYNDIERPAGRLCDRLKAEQTARFFGTQSSIG